MNKIILSIAIMAVAAITLGTAGTVFAQSPTPEAPVAGSGYGSAMGGFGNRGSMGARNGAGDQDGILHDAMINTVSEALGITAEELETRLEGGETLSQIAAASGLSLDQFRALMVEAHNAGIDQAVQNGTMTQEQAEWMRTRGARMANGQGGMRAGTPGQFNNGDCPYPQTSP